MIMIGLPSTRSLTVASIDSLCNGRAYVKQNVWNNNESGTVKVGNLADGC